LPEVPNGARATIQSRLAADPSVLFAILFGSRASGSPRADSDWDLAVFLDPSLDGPGRAAKRAHLIAGLEPEYRVDLVVLNDAPPLVAHRALCGERLFVRDQSTYVRFFVHTLALAFDESHWSEVHAKARRRRLEEGTFGRS
jgi:predicted nucleotidyltransferase